VTETLSGPFRKGFDPRRNLKGGPTGPRKATIERNQAEAREARERQEREEEQQDRPRLTHQGPKAGDKVQ
jgi:hypothetical protein